MPFLYIHLIAFVLFGCFLAFYFKSVIIVTFWHRLNFIKSAYTLYLSFLFVVILSAKDAYQQSIIRICNHWLTSSTVTPDLMPYKIPPRLALTVKSDTCTKTVFALIDTGAASSFISTNLAKKLNVKPHEVIEYANNEKGELVNIEVGKPNGNEFTKLKFELTPILFSSSQNISSALYSKIANVLSIPLFDLPEENTEEMLIGADLIPSLLYPSSSLPNRCILLASNLNLIETRLGYFLQGHQSNFNIEFCHNWLQKSFTVEPLNSFLSCVLITIVFLMLCDTNYMIFLYLNKTIFI